MNRIALLAALALPSAVVAMMQCNISKIDIEFVIDDSFSLSPTQCQLTSGTETCVSSEIRGV